MASGARRWRCLPRRAGAVSILVLVKYGLGARPRGPMVQRGADVSILVLVKYGLGAPYVLRSGVGLPDLVSILVLVKYGLGAVEDMLSEFKAKASQFLFW